jgi:LacI family transcriptional regulator
MAGKVTMQAIADRLGVSKYTVSRALSGKPGVGRDTRMRVLDMAEAMGYRLGPAPAADEPPAPARAGRAVLLLMRKENRRESDFWGRIKDGIDAACRQAGLECRFADEPAADAGADAVGLVVVGTVPVGRMLAFRSAGLPIVLIDHAEPLIRADIVLNDNLEASRMACSHLFAQGCASVAFVGRDRFSVSFKERWWGCKLAAEDWKKAHPDAGCALQKWTVPYPSDAYGPQLARRIREAGPDGLPDGFVCANDRIAMTLIEALRQAGVRVPERCRVVGIDNIEASAGTEPPLTTVDLAKEQLGARAVQALLRRMEHPHAPQEKIILSAQLLIRRSG